MGFVEESMLGCVGYASDYAGTMTLATIWILQLMFTSIYFSTIKTKVSRSLLISITVANVLLMPGIVVLPQLFSYSLPSALMLALIPVAVILEALLIFLPNRQAITIEKAFMFSVTICFISFTPLVFLAGTPC